MKIVILTNSIKDLEYENHMIFANCFFERGDDVYLGEINSLHTKNYSVHCKVAKIESFIKSGASLETYCESLELSEFDLAWVMNQPHHRIEKDVYQLLWILSQRVPFVNSLESIRYLNNKNTIGHLFDKQHRMETYVSNQFEFLEDIFSNSPRKWVVKPTNDGCGNDVFCIEKGQSNNRVILQSMTGNVHGSHDIYGKELLGYQNKYCLMQEYVSSVGHGEKRVMMAGGKAVCQYKKTMPDGEHRANFAQGGGFEIADLSQEETEFCETIATQSLKFGLRFVGFDLSYPYILEFNIVNPGGIQTLEPETNSVGPIARQCVENILASYEKKPGNG